MAVDAQTSSPQSGHAYFSKEFFNNNRVLQFRLLQLEGYDWCTSRADPGSRCEDEDRFKSRGNKLASGKAEHGVRRTNLSYPPLCNGVEILTSSYAVPRTGSQSNVSKHEISHGGENKPGGDIHRGDNGNQSGGTGTTRNETTT